MSISRSQEDASQVRGKLKFGRHTISLQDSINILIVEVDSQLRFDLHLEKVARNASQKVFLLRRMKHLLHVDGLLTLYKAQVTPVMEYAPLIWMSSIRCQRNLLDKIQRRTERLISGARHYQHQHRQYQNQEQQHEQQMDAAESLWDSLEHRRRAAALTVLHKSQVQHVPHLTDLRATWRRSECTTRTLLGNDSLLEVPKSQSSIHQKAFSTAEVVWWNALTIDVDVRRFST